MSTLDQLKESAKVITEWKTGTEKLAVLKTFLLVKACAPATTFQQFLNQYGARRNELDFETLLDEHCPRSAAKAKRSGQDQWNIQDVIRLLCVYVDCCDMAEAQGNAAPSLQVMIPFLKDGIKASATAVGDAEEEPAEVVAPAPAVEVTASPAPAQVTAPAPAIAAPAPVAVAAVEAPFTVPDAPVLAPTPAPALVPAPVPSPAPTPPAGGPPTRTPGQQVLLSVNGRERPSIVQYGNPNGVWLQTVDGEVVPEVPHQYILERNDLYSWTVNRPQPYPVIMFALTAEQHAAALTARRQAVAVTDPTQTVEIWSASLDLGNGDTFVLSMQVGVLGVRIIPKFVWTNQLLPPEIMEPREYWLGDYYQVANNRTTQIRVTGPVWPIP